MRLTGTSGRTCPDSQRHYSGLSQHFDLSPPAAVTPTVIPPAIMVVMMAMPVVMMAIVMMAIVMMAMPVVMMAMACRDRCRRKDAK